MSQQHRKSYTSFLDLLLIVIVVVIGIACDSILPEDFKKKDFSISEIDGATCHMFRDSLIAKTPISDVDLSNCINKWQESNYHGDILKIIIRVGIDTSFWSSHPVAYTAVARTIASFKHLVDTTTWRKFTQDSVTENQIIHPLFNTLVDNLPLLERDSLLVIDSYYTDSVGQKISYAVLKVLPGQSKDLYIYTSLFYNADNVNDYVTIRLLKSDTTEVAFSNDMPGETVSGCTQTIMVQSQERIVPVIRSRDKIHVEEGVYLVRFAPSNPLTIGEFKITISSF